MEPLLISICIIQYTSWKTKEQLNLAQNDNGEEDCTNKTIHEIVHSIPRCEDVTKRHTVEARYSVVRYTADSDITR